LTPKGLGNFKNLMGVLQHNGGSPCGVSDVALKKPPSIKINILEISELLKL